MTFKKKWNINILQRRSNQLWDDIQQIHNFFRPKRQSSALIAGLFLLFFCRIDSAFFFSSTFMQLFNKCCFVKENSFFFFRRTNILAERIYSVSLSKRSCAK